MSGITLCPPSGDCVPDPTVDAIRNLILDRSDEYWSRGSEDLGIHIEIGGRTVSMIAHFSSQHGFCLVYDDGEDLPKVLLGKAANTQRINVRLSRNPMLVPISYFVSKLEAFEALKSFVVSKELPWQDRWAVFSPEIY